MEYRETITLKDGRTCILRNGTVEDGKAVLDNFILTHEQTDNLLSYPDESDITAEREAQFLKSKSESACEIEILAEVDGVVAGLACKEDKVFSVQYHPALSIGPNGRLGAYEQFIALMKKEEI